MSDARLSEISCGRPSPNSCGSTIDDVNLAEAATAILVAAAMFSGGGGDVDGAFSWAKLAGGSVDSLSRRGVSFWLKTISLA